MSASLLPCPRTDKPRPAKPNPATPAPTDPPCPARASPGPTGRPRPRQPVPDQPIRARPCQPTPTTHTHHGKEPMTDTTRTVKISSLILDETLYPRHSISAANRSSIIEAIHAGKTLDPILVAARTNTVVDGFHRVHAYRIVYGPDHEITATVRTYRNRRQMLEDAITLNVGRGADLTRWDHLRCVALAEENGIPLDTLAGLLNWRPERLAAYRESRMGTTLDDRKLALKRSIRHRVHQPLSAEQEAANRHLSGMSPLFHANQLVTLLEADLLPAEDEHLAARLTHLASLIDTWIAKTPQPA